MSTQLIAPASDLPPAQATRRRVRVKWTSWILLLPVGLLLMFGFVWPIGTIILRSLNADGRATLSGATFWGHYTDTFTDPLLRQIAIHTFVVAAIATIVTVVLAFPVAYLMSRLPRRIAVVLILLTFLPFWVSILVRLFAFTVLLGRNGVANRIAEMFGAGPFSILFTTNAVVIGMVAYLLPYMILILYAGMSSIDPDLMVAARTMGATARQAFWRLFFPMVVPILVSGSLLVFVLGLGFFLTPAILGGATDLTIPVFIQQQIGIFEWGRASAGGVMLMLISILGYAVAIRIGGKRILSPSAGPASRGTVGREPLRRSTSTYILWIVSILVVASLLLPLLVVIPSAFNTTSQIAFPTDGLTTKWFEEVLTSKVWLSAIWKSVRIGLLTATVATGVGLILARTAIRIASTNGRLAFQAVVFAPLVIPVILLGIGTFDVQARLNLIGTDFGLVVAHTIVTFPFAYLILIAGVSSLDDSLEQAAWTMGASRTRAFWRVVIPNLIPSLGSAWVISFMTSWDEAVLALFQSGLSKTLPVTVFSNLKSGVTPAISAVSVLLMVPIVIAIAVFLVKRTRSGDRSSA